MSNRQKAPSAWAPDIKKSVQQYDAWYLTNSPVMFADQRGRAVKEVADAMKASNDFRDFTPKTLRAQPSAVNVARMAISPVMARDRFVGFSGANKSVVTSLERGVVPKQASLDSHLQAICDFLLPLLDPSLFCWLDPDRPPTNAERDKAMLVVGDRLAAATYLPALRNAQEARQKKLMRKFLEGHGFKESSAAAFDLPSGTFAFGRNVEVERADRQPQNLPVDCVVAPLDDDLPLACVEMKSAGDFANVNKRRKEESDKHEALRRTYGDDAIFLLQLFGYFGPPYLGFEASAGIDWAWDHRLDDLAPYFGI